MAGRPSATAIEQMRPPIDRPPRTRRSARMCAALTSAAASSRTAASSTGGRSGARRPALRYGKSMRATGSGATAASMATQRRVLAARPRARCQQQGSGLGHPSRIRRASDRSPMSLLADDSSPPWSGWMVMRRPRKRRHDLLRRRLHRAGLEAEHVEGPRDRVGEGHQRLGPRAAHAGEVAHERRADRSAPAHGLVEHAGDGVARHRAEAFGGVDRAQHLGQGRAVVLQLEADVLAAPDEAVGGAGQAVAVDLEAVAHAVAARRAGPARPR